MTCDTVSTTDAIIMVNLGKHRKPTAHEKTQIEFVRNRLRLDR